MQVILTIPEDLEDDWKADRFCGAVASLIEDGHEMRYSTYPSESWSTEEDQRLAFLLMDMLHEAVVIKGEDATKLQGEWDMFQRMTTAYYWKQCYFLQKNGLVYSRVSHTTMTRDDAIKEFLNEIYND